MIIEKIDNWKLEEVDQLDDTKSGDQGLGSSNTTMDQRVKGKCAGPEIEIIEISGRACGQFYARRK